MKIFHKPKNKINQVFGQCHSLQNPIIGQASIIRNTRISGIMNPTFQITKNFTFGKSTFCMIHEWPSIENRLRKPNLHKYILRHMFDPLRELLPQDRLRIRASFLNHFLKTWVCILVEF